MEITQYVWQITELNIPIKMPDFSYTIYIIQV